MNKLLTRQLGAFFIDLFICVSMHLVLKYQVILTIHSLVGINSQFKRGLVYDFLTQIDPFFQFLVFFSYFFLSNYLSEGLTLGKSLFGLKTLTFRNQTPSFVQYALRSFFKVLSIQLLYLPYLFSLFHSKRKALADLLSGTFTDFDPEREGLISSPDQESDESHWEESFLNSPQELLLDWSGPLLKTELLESSESDDDEVA